MIIDEQDLNTSLDYKTKSEVVYRNSLSSLYFLGELSSLHVGPKLLEIFYQPVWYLRAEDTKK